MFLILRSQKFKADELKVISKKINDLLSLFVGKMENVPSYILYNILQEGEKVLFKTDSDEVTISFASAIIKITDSKSYSKAHRKSKGIEVPLTGQEKRNMTGYYGQILPKTKTCLVSDFATSPLLQNIMFKGNIASAAVERILATESDEVLSVLSKLILNFVKMADVEGIATLTRQNVFDGIDSILIRCQNIEGLTDAITSLQLAHNVGKAIPPKIFPNWMTDFDNYQFEADLAEIAVGNKHRGMAKKKRTGRKSGHEHFVDVQCEIDNTKGLYDGCAAVEHEDEKQERKESKADEDGCKKNEEQKEIEEESRKMKNSEREKKETRNTSKEKNKSEEKTKQRMRRRAMNENEIETENLQKRKQGIGKDLHLHSEFPASTYDDISKKPFLPFSVRLKATLALLRLRFCYNKFQPLKNIVQVLMEGITLPEDAEAEYLKRKKQRASDGAVRGESEDNEFSDEGDFLELMNGKLNVFQIRYCILCIDRLSQYLRPSELLTRPKNHDDLSDNQFKALIDLLIRLNKFPDHLFFLLSSHCIEALSLSCPKRVKQLYLSTFESQPMEELDDIEEDMEKIMETYTKKVKERGIQKEETIIISTKFRNSYYDLPFDLKTNHFAPFHRVKKPLVENFETPAEYRFYCNTCASLYKFENRKNLECYTRTFTAQNIDDRFDYGNQDSSVTVHLFHCSPTALHFNHTIKCLGALCSSNTSICDDIVIRPFFERLMNRMSHPFPFMAPISVLNLDCDAFQQQTLESIQLAIDIFVINVMANIARELPFVFEMGFVRILFEWLINGRDSNRKLVLYPIQMIREACIAFLNISREIRINEVIPYNESVVARNKVLDKEDNKNYDAPMLAPIQTVSLLEINMCYQGYNFEKNYDTVTGKHLQMQLECFDEDVEELTKGEDVGICLLRLIDDTIEEIGIRDIVEATPQANSIQLFWLCSGSLPKKDRIITPYESETSAEEEIKRLPFVAFEPKPSDLSDELNLDNDLNMNDFTMEQPDVFN
ncbi:uncharacterized protein MONOS_12736 [Monocercomonoides exilis]|uniref:uncharacterized protein n=1 Tax=Monocercomonoides exilis TaxID=2049356 RepID=UPI003559CAD4|nr:hypothetical protein MONOS_12736 [Monocercomonoides exilis]|eukprot:MONOS_12736.1-p1 / transcript=MONOS_12736.1 / gene=MONOS_12736 / organism=Monocercomonoides_exilis_PA203 / gene_product=unspecified product / transcript_product=unspecified product / location=Mono_scaffold00726:30496-33641(+) / protein_length=1004 / sequence_SO=supercontig / SO=protein_coding / is_pseudo=false